MERQGHNAAAQITKKHGHIMAGQSNARQEKQVRVTDSHLLYFSPSTGATH